MNNPDPQEIYRTHMMEVKLRLVSALRVCGSNRSTLGLPAFDSEYCFLQMRRIVELITFGAAVKEEARYRKTREMDKTQNPGNYGDATKDWNASEILKILVNVSPHVLPIPIEEATFLKEGKWRFDRKSMSVNHGRLIEIYKESSGFLHTKNPLVCDFSYYVEKEREKYSKAKKLVEKQLKFLKSLIWKHATVTLEWTEPENPCVGDNAKSAWIIEFGDESSREISMVIGEAI